MVDTCSWWPPYCRRASPIRSPRVKASYCTRVPCSSTHTRPHDPNRPVSAACNVGCSACPGTHTTYRNTVIPGECEAKLTLTHKMKLDRHRPNAIVKFPVTPAHLLLFFVFRVVASFAMTGPNDSLPAFVIPCMFVPFCQEFCVPPQVGPGTHFNSR